MRAGQLRHTVELQSVTLTADGMGGSTSTWATTITTRAAIWPVSASEQVRNQQVEGRITHKIRIRYQAGVTGKMRVKFGSRYFRITAPPINPDERNLALDLLCEEIEDV